MKIPSAERWFGRKADGSLVRYPLMKNPPSTRRKRGLFITFEGPEGSGKSTHSRLLALWLRAQRRSVVLTGEPGGTAVGDEIRKILLDTRHKKMDALAELCLYEASRALLVKERIAPALRSGKVVVVDRFQDSTWVYQGWAGGLDLDFVEEIGRRALQGIEPDLTLLLDLPVREGLGRVRSPNRMEARPIRFHEKVRRGYLELARRHPKRVQRFSADRPVGQVQRAIREVVQRVLG